MNDLTNYFSDQRLVRILCRKRIDVARKARREQFICSIASTSGSRRPTNALCSMLPPRRAWNSFRPSASARRDPSIDAPTRLAHQMANHVLTELARTTARYRWVVRLRTFLDTIRSRALNWISTDSYTFDDIHAFPKNRPGNGEKYRIVASYSLSSSLICSGFASYLRDRIDSVLRPGVLAFRSAPPDGGKPPSHHNAIETIVNMVDATPISSDIWCAEVDIEGFFDAVSHDVAMRETKRVLSWTNHPIDPRLLAFLESFFRGYDFVGSAVQTAKLKLAKHGVTTPKFASPEKALRERGLLTNPSGRIGIPQGSSMSCVLANIVLSAADTLVSATIEAKGERGEGLYLRYCDDIIIMSRRKETCDEALNTYISALRSLKLPYHPPKEIAIYPGIRQHEKNHPMGWFWDGKSKASYPLSSSNTGKSVPWLAFVGYQVNRAGRVRVRKSSINKELTKQRHVAIDIIYALRKVAQKKRRRMVVHAIQDVRIVQYRAMMHLLSIGVGYPPEWSTKPAPGAVSWSNGFRGMPPHRAVVEPLRRLDMGRMRVLQYLKRRINRMIKGGLLTIKSAPPASATGSALTPVIPKFRLKFAGPPLSYRYQF